ncbi:MAG: heavy-metal-associated domain-containing protein [Clostridia bacterium]
MMDADVDMIMSIIMNMAIPAAAGTIITMKASMLTENVYILENLGCSNCAAKIERKINELDEVSEAVLTSG